MPHPTLGEDVACAVVLRTSTAPPVSAIALRRFAANHLAPFKVPSRIHIVNEIPKGDMGKPQRWLLAEGLYNKRVTPPSPKQVSEYAADDIFPRLHEIWARILERNDLGFNEDFFSAGGDSLTAMQMLAEVDQRFNSQTSAAAASFLDEPTLGHLVELVKSAPPKFIQNPSSEICVYPVSEKGTEERMFCVPANGEEGLYFRRLATHLQGRIDLSIVRPANAWFRESLYVLERAGEETAARIRETQPEGPYLVGGFCIGGVVAIEATRQLIRQGQEVRLVLFETMLPGYPSLLRGWRAWAESARLQWRDRGRSDNENYVLNPRYLLRRMIWSAALPARGLLTHFEDVSILWKLLHWSLYNYSPLYRPHPIDAPILHFISADTPNAISRASRFGWRRLARRGIREEVLSYDHANILHEHNLPKIVDVLLPWLEHERQIPEAY